MKRNRFLTPDMDTQSHGKAWLSYEVILVDDGSQDRSWEVIRRLNQEDGRLKDCVSDETMGISSSE
jgi:glycosyltransferase involved in cell wall biosynthesis